MTASAFPVNQSSGGTAARFPVRLSRLQVVSPRPCRFFLKLRSQGIGFRFQSIYALKKTRSDFFLIQNGLSLINR